MQRPPDLAVGEFHGILTRDAEIERLFDLVRRVARSERTVQILGESGTGKELFARAIHAESPRSVGPFHAVNSATLSATLLESELFGHRKGAFTGAIRDHPGLFRLADRGTLFLDEVCEIPYEIQGKLLRALQEKSFFPVGGTRPVTVDVRVLSASNRSIEGQVRLGRFRSDLNYRLRVLPLYIPPLRARRGDIALLFWHFVALGAAQGLRSVEAVSRSAMELVESHPWPGNVRQLQSLVEYALIAGDGPLIDVRDLTPEVRGEPDPFGALEDVSPRDAERERIRAALARHRGRKGDAARDLGMSRQTLWRKLYLYDLA